MSNNNIKRKLFFWIDDLQIGKQERISITILFLVVIIGLIVSSLISERVVPTPENQAGILEEFNRRSAELKKNKKELEKKYNPVIEEETDINKIDVRMERQDIAEESVKEVSQIISINSASITELESLPGIGNTYAKRIIEFRETNGRFTSVEDLVKVRGIGAKTLEKLKPYVEL